MSSVAALEGRFDLLMVCLGNICRSPMMERLLTAELAARLDPAQARRFRVHGAGTYAEVGQPIYPPAARVLAAVGADPSGFAARQFRVEMARDADLILTATVSQRNQIRTEVPQAAGRVFTLKELAGLAPRIPASAATGADPVQRAKDWVAAADAARHQGEWRGGDWDVADPYGAGEATFRACRDEIVEALTPLVEVLSGEALPATAPGPRVAP